MSFRALDKTDPDIANLIRNEYKRQSETLELIASENLTSPAVLEALGTLLTNKYAEGYPGRRYYGGTGEVIDKIESLAVERAQKLFGADYVNVQPHSGSQANAAVYMAVCQPGDRVMGMDLSAGGHLTHGSPANFSGKLYEIHSYGVSRETETIDYDAMEKLAKEVRPKMIIGGFSAYSRVVDWARMRQIADSVEATFFVDMAHVAGLVAGGVYPSPIPHADIVSTTTQKRTGKQVQDIADTVGITLNRNSIPYDEASKFNPSGVRVGTPLVTTRGMREPEMAVIADCLADLIERIDDPATLDSVHERSLELCRKFPLPYAFD